MTFTSGSISGPAEPAQSQGPTDLLTVDSKHFMMESQSDYYKEKNATTKGSKKAQNNDKEKENDHRKTQNYHKYTRNDQKEI